MPGSTPVFGFPYPDPSDLVANYPALGQQLAEDVEDEIIASGGLVLVASQSFTTVSSASINSCFTSAYLNYKIVLSSIVSAGNFDLKLRLRAAGTDDTGSNYLVERGVFAGAGISGVSATETSFVWLPVSTVAGFGYIDLNRVNLASTTFMNSFGGNNQVLFNISGYHNQSTAYDGFTFFVDSGTLTGTIRVYGYKD